MSNFMTPAELRDWLVNWVNNNISAVADKGGADPDRPLEELGLSSRDAVSLVGELEELLDRTIPPTLAWELPTINLIAAHLVGDGAVEGSGEDADATDTPAEAIGAQATQPAEESLLFKDDLIAVVGVGCRLPGGVDGPESYWELLTSGRDAVTTVPDGRWEQFVNSTPANDALLASATRWGGFLDDVAGFDPEFFGIAPREAELADPQQRLLLQVAWEALEHAGINPETLRGSNTGVYVGISASEYSHLTMGEITALDAWTATGSALSIAANRISYLLDLRGPSQAVDTACSSSLVALHNAVTSLRSGEISAAIVGGANLLLSPTITLNFDLGGALAADGRCKSFAAGADGIVRGEGAGAVVLKRLGDAQRDGDRVLAVIRGTAVNQDGRSNGLTAPNPVAQAALLRDAYAHAGIDPTSVDYIEAHGTGTLLGDPIEAGAMGAALGRARQADKPLLIGSVKSNIGHLESAAGIAGLIKLVLALHNGRIPASLHAQTLNPHIPFEADRLKVATAATDWPRYSGSAIGGVSGFGFGGTNAHAILGEYRAPVAAQTASEQTPAVALAISARSADRLTDVARSLADWLLTSDDALPDVAHSLIAHRGAGAFRAVVAGRDRAELVEALRAVGSDDARVVSDRIERSQADAGPVFVYSGYGSQWTGMGARLVADEPVFAQALTEVSDLMRAQTGFDVQGAIGAGAQLRDVAQSQAAIFCVQIALTALWRSRGVEPAAVIGHSMGEVSAAVAAGALSLADGVHVMAVRSALLSAVDGTGGNGMGLLDITPAEFERWLPEFPGLNISVYASPTQCTVGGPAEVLRALADKVESLGRDAWIMKVSGAAHSPEVDPILGELLAKLDGISPGVATVPFYSTALKDPRATPAFDELYWAANARQPVRFTQAVAAAALDGHDIFLEVSPHPVASVNITRTLSGVERAKNPLVVASLRRDTDDSVTFTRNLGRLHARGLSVKLASAGRFVELPTTGWRNSPYWFSAPARTVTHAGDPFAGTHVELPEGGRHLWSNPIGEAPIAGLALTHAFAVDLDPVGLFFEIAFAAVGQVRRRAGLLLTDVVAHAPLARAANTVLTTSYTAADGRVQIFSRNGKRGSNVLHFEATVGQESAENIDAFTQDVGLLPEPANPSHEIFSARATVLQALVERASAALPTGQVVDRVGSVRVLGEVGNGGRLRVNGASAQLVDDAGTVLAQVSEVSGRVLARHEVRVPLERLFYSARMVPTPLPSTNATAALPEGVWLMLDGASSPAAATVRELRGAGAQVRELASADLAAQLAALDGQPVAAAVLFCADTPETDPISTFERDRNQVLTVGQLSTLLTEALPTRGGRLWIVTAGAYPVQDDEAGRPGQFALRSAVRTLAIEQPMRQATLVDLDPDGDGHELLSELLGGALDDEVAYRKGERYAMRLAPALVPEPEQSPVNSGAYVLSGGLGGIGFELGRWLLEQGARVVVLSSRRNATAVQEVQAAGWPGQVHFVPGDITSPQAAQAAIEAATAGGVPLRGVAHLAGVSEHETLFQDLREDDLAQLWHTKVKGAWELHRAVVATGHAEELDWFVSFSSAAALAGSPGQVAYSTANAWLDGFAQWQRAQGLPGQSINWGAWLEIGGAATNENPLLDPISPAEAFEAFGLALGSSRPWLAIWLLDAARAAQALPSVRTVPYFEALLEVAGAQANADQWDGLEAIRTAAPDEAAMLLRDRVVERIAAVMGSAPGALEMDSPLIDMGFDSLMATRAKNSIEHDLGLALPTKLVLNGASLRDLAVHLGGELGLDMSVVAGGFATANASLPGNDSALQLRPDGASTDYMPPRDPSERFLVLIWSEVLARAPIGVNDDFYGIGGDEAKALLVRERICERLTDVPPVETLFAAATIAQQADLVREELEGNKGRPVRVLRGTGSRIPLFLFHPAGGPTSVYAPLVEMLSEDQPVYGLERIGDATSVEAKVEQYLPLIREIQPHGPYRLMGWSFGGIMAGEVADQLLAAGEEVDFVARLDTIIPLIDPDADQTDVLIERYRKFAEYIKETYDKDLVIPYDDLPGMSEAEHIAMIGDALTSVGVGMPPGVLEHQYTSYVDARIAEQYQPKVFNGRMILYRASQHEAVAATLDPRYRRTDEKLGWDEYSPNMEVVRVPGDHISMIDRPNVDAIAAHLEGVLAQLSAHGTVRERE